MERIAIIVPNLGITNYLVDFAEKLANSDCSVDLYYREDLNQPFCDFSLIESNHLSFLKIPINYELITIENYEIFFQSIEKKILNEDQLKKYNLLIGVEKEGIILASRISKKLDIPYIYWSLELYEENHVGWNSWMPHDVCKFLCDIEQWAYKKSTKVIVQDQERGRYLDTILKFNHKGKIFFPVCFKKISEEKKNYFLYDLCDIPHDKKILFLFGNHRIKGSWILEIANSLPEPWLFVLHGLREEEIKKAFHHKNLYVSHEKINNLDIQKLISSADIGFVHYENVSTNDILTAHSSEKISRYLACSLPIIAHDVGNFPNFFKKYNCGFLYNDPKEIGNLVKKIEENYSYFSSNAQNAFKDYSFDNKITDVIKEITSIIHPRKETEKSDIRLSVIIPTLNRHKSLETTLKCLASQTLDPKIFEILVIDNGSTDATKDIVDDYIKNFPNLNLRFLKSSPKGLLSGRQKGMEESLGNILTFLDDDIITWQGFLSSILEAFNFHPDIVMAGGPCIPQYEVMPPSWIQYFNNQNNECYRNGYLSICNYGNSEREISPSDIWGLNFSIKKDILIKLGGFFPDGVPEDKLIFRGSGESGLTEMLCQKKYKAWYSPQICVSHVIPEKRLTKEYFLKRAFSQGISESYQKIRQTKHASIYQQIDYKKENLIADQVYNSYVDGYLFHRKVANENPSLVSWILRENYINDYEYPNTKIKFLGNFSATNKVTKTLIEGIIANN